MVLGGPRLSVPDLEHAETAQLDPVALAQLDNDGVEKRLNDLPGDCLTRIGVVGDPVDNLFLRDGGHQLIVAQNDRRCQSRQPTCSY